MEQSQTLNERLYRSNKDTVKKNKQKMKNIYLSNSQYINKFNVTFIRLYVMFT